MWDDIGGLLIFSSTRVFFVTTVPITLRIDIESRNGVESPATCNGSAWKRGKSRAYSIRGSVWALPISERWSAANTGNWPRRWRRNGQQNRNLRPISGRPASSSSRSRTSTYIAPTWATNCVNADGLQKKNKNNSNANR